MLLKINQVGKSFGGLRALDDVSLTVEQGAIVSLIGANGAGKTTLLNIISGVDKPSSGSLFLDGNNITNLAPPARVANGMSRTFQISSLFEGMTVQENILVGGHLHINTGVFQAMLKLPGQRAKERAALERTEKLMTFLGIEGVAGKFMKELPYGQQRMVQLARALATQPRLLLLDEVSAGLSPREVGDLEKLLKQIQSQGITLLVVEHNVPLVMRLSDKVVVLHLGRKIAEGKPSEITRDQQVLDCYLGAETGHAAT